MKILILRALLALLIAASLFQPLAAPAAAADAVTLTVRPGFDGLVRVGSWLPVQVDVANHGRDIEGTLELQVDGAGDRGSAPVIQSTPAVLPAYSEKRYLVNVYVPTVDSKVTARLRTGGNVLLERDVPLDPLPSGEILCGLLSRNPASLSFLSTIQLTARQRDARLAKLEVADLPSRPQALSSLGCMIISNPPAGTLDDQQVNALQTWVAEGGLLIVTGGPSWQRATSILPASLLPVRVTGTTSLTSLDSLSAYAQQPIGEPGPWLVSQAEVTAGSAVIQENGVPILVAARYGAGGVMYLALDPTTEPLHSWAGSEALWRSILGNVPAAVPSPSSPARQYSGWGRVPVRALADVSNATLPSASPLAFLILGYVLLLLAIAFVGIRRVRRPGFTAAMLGLVVLVATGSSFAVAEANRDADVVSNQVTLVRAWDGHSPASTHSFVSFYSERESRFSAVASGNSLIYWLLSARANADSVLRVTNGESPTVNDYSLLPSSSGVVITDGTSSAVAVAAELTLADGRLRGAVTNRSGQTLANASLVAGRQVVPLGTLVPGQSRRLEVNLDGSSPAGYLDNPDLASSLVLPSASQQPDLQDLQQEILDAALGLDYDAYSQLDLSAVNLVAWLGGDDALPLTVQGARMTAARHTLLVQTLPVRFPPGTETAVPPQLLERRPLAVNAGNMVQRSDVELASGDSVSTEYTLPVSEGGLAVDSLAINVRGTINDRSDEMAARALGSAFLYDWQKAVWSEVPLTFGRTDVSNPQRFVSSLGVMRVRYTFSPPPGGELDHLALSTFDLMVGGHAQ